MTQLYDGIVYGPVLSNEVSAGIESLDNEASTFYFYQNWKTKYPAFVTAVNKRLESNSIKFKLETDITGFFDGIPHSRLLFKIFR